MGLRLEKELDTGFSLSYWRVAKVEINYESQSALITLLIYKDKAARDAGKRPQLSLQANCLPSDIDNQDADNLVQGCYLHLKQLPVFADAQDE